MAADVLMIRIVVLVIYRMIPMLLLLEVGDSVCPIHVKLEAHSFRKPRPNRNLYVDVIKAIQGHIAFLSIIKMMKKVLMNCH